MGLQVSRQRGTRTVGQRSEGAQNRSAESRNAPAASVGAASVDAASAGTAPVPVPEDPLGWRLERIRRAHRVPTLTAVVTRSDGVIASAAVGLRALGSDTLVQKSDRFHLGSNTKSMTATLIAVFVEDGKLAWDTCARHHLHR